MRIVVWITTLALFACASSTTPSNKPQADPKRAPITFDDRIGLATSYLESGRPEKALDVARTAITDAPKRAEGHVVAARALAAMGRLEPAIVEFERARSLGARERRVTIELAAVYDVLQRYEDAIATYTDHVKRFENDAEAHQQLGLTLLLVGRPDAAISSLETARRLAPKNKQIAIDYGLALTRVGRTEEARRELEAVTQTEPERADAWRILARAEAIERRWEAALDHVDRALALQANDIDALALRCRLRLFVGHPKQALSDCQALRELVPNDRGFKLRTAGVLSTLGNTAQAKLLVDDVANELPDHPAVRFRQDQILARMGDPTALPRIVALASSRPDDPEIWLEVRALARSKNKGALEKRANDALHRLGLTPLNSTE